MKTRTVVVIPIFIFVVVAIFFFVSCTTTGSGDGNGPVTPGVTPTYDGTWVNSDYDGISGVGEGGNPAKAVIIDIGGDDYTVEVYFNHDDTVPQSTFTITLTDAWTDSE